MIIPMDYLQVQNDSTNGLYSFINHPINSKSANYSKGCCFVICLNVLHTKYAILQNLSSSAAVVTDTLRARQIVGMAMNIHMIIL